MSKTEKLTGKEWFARFEKLLPQPVDVDSKYEFNGETDFDTTRVEEVKVLVEMSEDNGWNNALSQVKRAAQKAAGLTPQDKGKGEYPSGSPDRATEGCDPWTDDQKRQGKGE